MMPEKEAVKIMTNVLSAVSYLHKNHIIHMDLKPENILFLSKEGYNIKLVDFHHVQSTRGYDEVPLIKKPLPSAAPEEPVGTPYYIAPEVLSGSFDEKCDIWSIGCILYTMLTGFPPFTGRDDAEILAKVSLGQYCVQTLEDAELSLECIELISKMLTFDSFLRISADEALKDPWILDNQARSAENPGATIHALT